MTLQSGITQHCVANWLIDWSCSPNIDSVSIKHVFTLSGARFSGRLVIQCAILFKIFRMLAFMLSASVSWYLYSVSICSKEDVRLSLTLISTFSDWMTLNSNSIWASVVILLIQLCPIAEMTLYTFLAYMATDNFMSFSSGFSESVRISQSCFVCCNGSASAVLS